MSDSKDERPLPALIVRPALWPARGGRAGRAAAPDPHRFVGRIANELEAVVAGVRAVREAGWEVEPSDGFELLRCVGQLLRCDPVWRGEHAALLDDAEAMLDEALIERTRKDAVDVAQWRATLKALQDAPDGEESRAARTRRAAQVVGDVDDVCCAAAAALHLLHLKRDECDAAGLASSDDARYEVNRWGASACTEELRAALLDRPDLLGGAWRALWDAAVATREDLVQCPAWWPTLAPICDVLDAAEKVAVDRTLSAALTEYLGTDLRAGSGGPSYLVMQQHVEWAGARVPLRRRALAAADAPWANGPGALRWRMPGRDGLTAELAWPAGRAWLDSVVSVRFTPATYVPGEARLGGVPLGADGSVLLERLAGRGWLTLTTGVGERRTQWIETGPPRP